ncbi:MAG: hydrogenase expression/formation protein HypE [Desulfovibrio sp.]|nr:hydrogenase expression/formation protein HypE [Desulfovibrio sp.]
MEETVNLDAGSGGRASARLIENVFLKYFGNEISRSGNDAAKLSGQEGSLAFSVDSYTVSPIFFPGGSIGSLAVTGTVNDVAMLGAEPEYLSAAFIIEEGFPLADLEKIARDMADACDEAGVKIATGDTKVTPKGACDKIFISTSGIGKIYAHRPPSGSAAKPGDVVLVSGTMGDHGLTVMAAREDASFITDVKSDCAPLNGLIKEIIRTCGDVHVLRDPTRGGLATTLNEISGQSGVGIEIDETVIPLNPAVADGCSCLGLDPLYLANEGKLICIVPADRAADALRVMRASKYGQEAAIIGKVIERDPGKVWLKTAIGGKRYLDMLEGAQLPRIC